MHRDALTPPPRPGNRPFCGYPPIPPAREKIEKVDIRSCLVSSGVYTRGMSNEKNAVKIATFHLAAARDFHPGQEFAGATDTIRVEAGDYDVLACADSYGRLYFVIKLDGVHTFSGWYGSNTRESKPMTPRTHYEQPYCYQLAERMIKGEWTQRRWNSERKDHDVEKLGTFTLEPGISAGFSEYESAGKTRRLHHIEVNGAETRDFKTFREWRADIA